MKKLITIAGLLFGCAGKAAHHDAKVTMDAARAKALAQVAGTIKEEELEQENGRWIYTFEIAPTGETGKIVKEVNIDADTGELVNIETETAD